MLEAEKKVSTELARRLFSGQALPRPTKHWRRGTPEQGLGGMRDNLAAFMLGAMIGGIVVLSLMTGGPGV